MILNASQAINRLKEGNKRFASGVRSIDSITKQVNKKDLIAAQEPFAIILGCSDARVPAEIIFDQGLGDLFVIRVAGKIVAPSQIGSIEFAVERFGTPLVIVLGHTHCGAVTATVEVLEKSLTDQSQNVLSIVNRIRPSVEPLFSTELRHETDKLLKLAIRANIHASVNQLCHGSQMLERLVQKGSLKIIGAEYCLEKGEVDFFE